MADTRVSVQKVIQGGLTTAYTGTLTATTIDYVFKNDGKTFLHCKKSGAGACTVTMKTPAQVGGLDIAEVTGTVPATTGDVMFGPFNTGIFNDTNGDMRVNYSEVTGLTHGVFQVGG
jgi:hypothetical protein